MFFGITRWYMGLVAEAACFFAGHDLTDWRDGHDGRWWRTCTRCQYAETRLYIEMLQQRRILSLKTTEPRP